MTKLDYFESERQKELPYLEAAVTKYDMIFIDTSSVMWPGFAKFAANILPLLKKHNKKIVLCSSVLRELNKLRQKGDDETTLVREVYATMGLFVLERFGISGVLSKVDDGITEGPADFAFQKLFITLRTRKRLLLIAQDGNLTNTILRFNLDKSVFAASIGVKQVNFDGFLEPKSHIDAATAEAIKKIANEKQPQVQAPIPVREKYSGAFTAKDAKNLDGTDLVIPDGFSSIGFTDRTDITSVKLPKSVTSIGEQAFKDCDKLISIEWHDGISSIGQSAFYSCTSLKSVTIPKATTALNNAVFRGCSSLSDVQLHNTLTRIGMGVFKDCSKLTHIDIPDSVTDIGKNAFLGCPDIVVKCNESSYAHGYCLVNNIKFITK